MKKDDIGRLEDILLCIEKIEKYAAQVKKTNKEPSFLVHSNQPLSPEIIHLTG